MKIRISVVILSLLGFSSNLLAFGVFDFGQPRAARWDAAPRMISGAERSLDGGLRFAIEGMSYAAFKNEFTWVTTPSDSAFEQAILDAFDAWTVTDPTSGLGTTISFQPDLTLAPTLGGGTADDFLTGAEIDLFGGNIGSGTRGLAGFWTFFPETMDLTSGTTITDGSLIAGSQITLNNNMATWTLQTWQDVLTHEIGHTLGLADVEIASDQTNSNVSEYLDDDDVATSLDPADLEDSFALLINQTDPEGTVGLIKNTFSSTLFDQRVDDSPFLLMETDGDAGAPSPAILSNDEFAGRQFLYPTAVPEPSAFLFVALVLGGAGVFKKSGNWFGRKKK